MISLNFARKPVATSTATNITAQSRVLNAGEWAPAEPKELHSMSTATMAMKARTVPDNYLYQHERKSNTHICTNSEILKSFGIHILNGVTFQEIVSFFLHLARRVL